MKKEKKTIVRANNSFKLWLINTWVTHIKIKSFSNLQIYVSMATDVTLCKIAIAKQLKYL